MGCNQVDNIIQDIASFINELLDIETKKQVLIGRVDGETIRETAQRLNMTDERIRQLQNLIDNGEQSGFDLKEFLRNVHKYTDPKELTAELLNDLVDKIVIHAPTRVAGNVNKRLKITTRLPESSIFISMIVLLRMVEKSVGKRAKLPNNAEWRYSLSLYRHTT